MCIIIAVAVPIPATFLTESSVRAGIRLAGAIWHELVSRSEQELFAPGGAEP